MMDYQSFKDVVVEKILDFMPPEYANAIVEVLILILRQRLSVLTGIFLC